MYYRSYLLWSSVIALQSRSGGKVLEIDVFLSPGRDCSPESVEGANRLEFVRGSTRYVPLLPRSMRAVCVLVCNPNGPYIKDPG